MATPLYDQEREPRFDVDGTQLSFIEGMPVHLGRLAGVVQVILEDSDSIIRDELRELAQAAWDEYDIWQAKHWRENS